MKTNWTAQQKNAIDSRKGTVLVSAAAGSGKTAVLVQRIIERLTQKQNPGSVDRLLVVTFTKAAAAEMRMRISARLNDELIASPDNRHLKKQLSLLPTAKINTIDSFLSALVRDNFHELGISPDFMICSDTQKAVLCREAVDWVIEEMYQSSELSLLADTITESKEDSALASIILEMHDFLMSFPFPEKWMEHSLAAFDPENPDFCAEFKKIIRDSAIEKLENCIKLCSKAQKLIECSEEIFNAYEKTLANDSIDIQGILSLIKTGEWNDICGFSYKFANMPRYKENAFDASLKKTVSDIRSKYKDELKAALDLFSANDEQLKQEVQSIARPVRLLFEAATLFNKKYSELKAARNLLDFSDLLHLSLRLLTDNSSEQPQRSRFAVELSEQFDEILIDEYQDTNYAQNAIFEAISANGQNLFMVGDVKQSIYRFRQAVPEIFMQKLNSLPYYDAEKENYPSKILLDSNFRSRKQITDAVNFVFSRLMTKELCSIDYNDGHALNAAAAYPLSDEKTVEAMLVDCTLVSDNKSTDCDRYEAAAIGKRILDMINDKVQVRDGDGTRDCTFGDFCILLQTHRNKAHIYFERLSAMGIPVWTQGSDSLFAQSEILSFISLLKVFDNPLQDVDLLCALHDPVFGFTDDDIAFIRLNNKDVSLYGAIGRLADENEKCRRFIEACDRYRRLSYSLPSDRLISTIFEELSYPEIISAVHDDPLVKNNLLLLYDIAKSYESLGTKGLCAFLRHIDRMSMAQNSDISSANMMNESADVVRIMTIHKSKGLEFPICIIADNDRSFIKKNKGSKLLYHQRLGCATVIRNELSLKEKNPLAWQALCLAINNDMLGESLRLLYVAMTRAKERLIFTVTSSNMARLCEKSLSLLDEKGVPSAGLLRSSGCFAEWILCCALQKRGAQELLQKYDISPDLIPAPDEIDDWSIYAVTPDEDEEQQETLHRQMPTFDEHTVKLIEKLTSRRYDYEQLCAVPSKLTVSQLSHGSEVEQLCAVKKPKFSDDYYSPTQRGTVLHTIMQSIDFVHPIESVAAHALRLAELGIITQQHLEGVDLNGIEKFISSELYAQIAAADEILREYPFSVLMPISQIEGMPRQTGESVVVEGIVDLIFIKNGAAAIVDYKSDRCFDPAEFVERYSAQLKLYSDAIERVLEIPVERKLIYSMAMNRAIEL